MGMIRSIKRTAGKFRKNFASGGWDGWDVPIWSPEHRLNQNMGFTGLYSADREAIGNNFEAYVRSAFKSDGPVFSCIIARQFVFSQARFKFRDKATGKLFGSPALQILETPWEGGKTEDLLAQTEQHGSLAGNAWWTRADDLGNLGDAAKGGPNERLVRLNPAWVQIMIGSFSGDPRAADAKALGISYQPLGPGFEKGDKTLLLFSEIGHFAPIPDPDARFRGMSWLTPVLREVEADKGATIHKGAFFDNAAVPNMAVSFDKDTNEDDFDEFVASFKKHHQGKLNAYKTLFLMGGADVTPLTQSFKELDFAATQGKGESRIASAAGVPSSWVGFSEGMQGSALNSGNIAASRRRFADGTMRTLWQCVCAAFEPLVEVPPGAELWYDDTDIAFLREDQTDRADIMTKALNALDSGIKCGYEPDAVAQTVQAELHVDLTPLIGHHTGLVSVQMQPPVDPDDKMEETKGMAQIALLQMQAIDQAVTAGFTHESAVEWQQTNDLSKLVKSNDVEPWSPTGQPLREPGPGADAGKPAQAAPAPGQPAPGGKPTSTPTGAPTKPGGGGK